MITFEIICLAKSIKNGSFCIAGLKTDGSGWLRPVSDREDGTLYLQNLTLDNGNEPQLFDIIKIHFIKERIQYHQPENWVIDRNKVWDFIGRATLEQAQKLINPEVIKHHNFPKLLGNLENKTNYEDLKKAPAESSLALIMPNQIQWCINTFSNKRKATVIFSLGETSYNFPITDPVWKSKLEQLNDGRYSSKELIDKLELEHFDPKKFFFTISLGEPFAPSNSEQKFCYKLVASVINSSDVKKRLEFG